MHREYLKKQCYGRYSSLLLTGKLWSYLEDLDEQAEERFTCIVDQMKAAEGVTEELKRKDAMLWVQRCNNIRNRAEEIVLNEMVYICLLYTSPSPETELHLVCRLLPENKNRLL